MNKKNTHLDGATPPINGIDISNHTHKKKWDAFINDLDFKCVNRFTDEMTYSQIKKHELDNKDIFVNIDSSAYVSHLEFCGKKEETLIIVNSITSLQVVDDKNKLTIANGHSILLPAGKCFELNSNKRRKSSSFILNMNDICNADDFYLFEEFHWNKDPNFSSGLNIDKIMHR